MGLPAILCAYFYASRLGWCREDDLLYILILLPPTPGAFLLLVRRKNHVFPERDPECMAKHHQSHDPSPVRWERNNGLEDRLVRPHDLFLYERVVLRGDLVSVASQGQTAFLVGICTFAPSHCGGWDESHGQ